MLLWVMGGGGDLTTLAHFQESKMSPGLFQDFSGWTNIVEWLWLRVPNQDGPRLNSMDGQISISVLWNLCLESVEDIKFRDLVEDSDTGSLSSVTVRIEYFFAFQFWYWELCVENRWGECRKQCFVNFCSLVVL